MILTFSFFLNLGMNLYQIFNNYTKYQFTTPPSELPDPAERTSNSSFNVFTS